MIRQAQHRSLAEPITFSRFVVPRYTHWGGPLPKPPGLVLLGMDWMRDREVFARPVLIPFLVVANWLLYRFYDALRFCVRNGFLIVPEGDLMTPHAKHIKNWRVRFWKYRYKRAGING
jgi:hypothetical protein